MEVRIELTYRTPSGTEAVLHTEEMLIKKALLIAEDLEKTGRMKKLIFIDQYDTSWTKKQLQKFIEEIQTEPHNITVYFDGGFDQKTKKSGLGCVIYYEQNNKSFRLRKNALVEELKTNNEAEYAALHLGLVELENLGAHHLTVTFIGDSQVVTNQLNDEWPCFEPELNAWMDRIENMLQKAGISAVYELIPRKKNREADHLASQALRGVDISSTIKLDKE